MTKQPDVTVIVPVYNAMPYLTDCLSSLVGQSIGAERMEIVAVDDGSTDGSGKELDRFAQLHPGLLRVLHQPNSGGPASPCNHALDVAAGRYVYFVGADDYVGPEALQRLVEAADEHDSDVVAGKMVGANGRYVHQALYRATDYDVDLFDSALPWSMSNVKLFRRELIERHGLRFPEDMPVCSDQPFTLEACLQARRISVLADYTFYHAVMRNDAANITYRTSPEVNLACARRLMEFVAARVEAGPRRDAILRRHFAWELFKILTVDFLRLGEEAQRELCQGVAQLADDYLTEPIRHGLVVRRRLPIALAQAGELPLLRQVVRQVVDEVTPPLVLDGDRVFMAYAGFFDRPASIGEDCYEVIGGGFTGRISERLRLTSLAWADGAAGPELTVRMHLDMAPRAAGDPRALPVRAEAVRVGPGRDDTAGIEPELPVHVETADDHRSSRLSLRIPVDQLAQASGGRARWGVRLLVGVAGDTYRVPVPGGPGRLPRRHWWHGRRPFGVSVGHAKQPRLQLLVEPVRLSAVLRRGRALMSAIRRK